MSIRMTRNNVPLLLAAMEGLTRKEVLVGIPGETTQRKDPKQLTNAMLGYIHEFGAPAANIPARPFLRPGIAEGIPAITRALVGGARRALILAARGDPDAVDKAFHGAGLAAASSVKRYINRGVDPPLSPVTIYKRRHRKVAPRMGTKPLIDTGQLRNAITYVIRPKRK